MVLGPEAVGKGKFVSVCRCGASATYPLCDGAHKTVAGDEGPVRVKLDRALAAVLVAGGHV